VRLLVVAVALVVSFPLAATASASSSYSDSFSGTEIIPVSSVRGTFVGVARGDLPAVWRTQIVHKPLSSGPTVAVTGGKFSVVGVNGVTLGGAVTGGSVTVVNRGSRCSNQTYRVSVAFAGGTFDGTLTHHRRTILGNCIIYAATISGRGTLAGS
jgi:hypothetical protein